MGNNNLGMLLGAFILILVGIVLINSVADSVSELDDVVPLNNNESITWTVNNSAITLANDDIVSGSEAVYNNGTILTVTTDYTMTDSSITFLNASSVEYVTDQLNISYTHEGDNYLDDSTSRSLINLVILFFALTILAVGYVLVMRAYNNINI